MEIDAYWYEDDDWRGYLPIEPISALLDRHVFRTWVAGLRYYGAEDDPSFGPGSPLRLIPDPDNTFDPNAIAVWNEGSTQQAGHIPRYIADDLDPAHDRTALALYEQTADGRRVNLGILIGREPLSLRQIPDTGERSAWAARIVMKLKAALASAREPDQPTGDPMEQMWRMAEELEEPRGDFERGSP